MNIDNSRANSFKNCPWMYYEQYERGGVGIEKVSDKEGYSALEFGDRVHQLLEEWYKQQGIYPNHENDVLETEAQLMIEAYKAKYPVEEFELIDCERTIKVQLPKYCKGCYSLWDDSWEYGNGLFECEHCHSELGPTEHVFIGKIDIVYRDPVSGGLFTMDHKTEKRGAKSNLPQKWAERDQASLYLWAAERIYKEKPSNFIVNVLTRQSEKGQIGPSFPERQKLERSQGQIEHAVRDLVYWADKIEEAKRTFGDSPWPANREKCYEWGPCEFQLIHGYGDDVEQLIELKYEVRKPYLNLEGVEVVK
jgi:hypothetical protein